MAVDVIETHALQWSDTNVRTFTLGVTVAAGHLACVDADFSTVRKVEGPRGTGWTYRADNMWWKRLTAADITAGTITVDGRMTALTIFSGARDLGNRSDTRSIYLREAGAGLFTFGWTDWWEPTDTLNTPATGKLGASCKIVASGEWVAHWFKAGTTVGNSWLERDYNAAGYRSWEVRPAAAPGQPTLLTPADGVNVDAALAIPLAWTHSGTMVQQARRVRARAVGSGTWLYLDSTGRLVATEQTVTTSDTTAEIDPGELTTGTLAEWSVATMENGTWSAYQATAATFMPQSRPTLTVTFTTTAEDLTPSGASTPTTYGGAQTAYRTVVLPAATASVSDEVAAVTPWQPGAGTNVTIGVQDWTNGGSYKLWWQIEQAGGLMSVWTASTAQTISWTPPAAPSSVTATDGTPLTIAVAGISAGMEGVLLEWASKLSDDWEVVAIVTDPGTSEVIPIPLAPYAVERRYRARVWNEVDGVAIPSAWTTIAAAVATTDKTPRLVTVDGSEWLDVTVASHGAVTPRQGYWVGSGLGAEGAIVERTAVAGYAGTHTLSTDTKAEWEALSDWLTDLSKPQLWWRQPPLRETDTGAYATADTLLVSVAVVPSGAPISGELDYAGRLTPFQWVTQ